MAGSFHSSAYLRSPRHGHLSYQLSVKALRYFKTSVEFESLSETFGDPSSTIILIFLWIPACLVGSLTNAVHHCHLPLHAFPSPAAGYTSRPEKNHVLGLPTQFADCRYVQPKQAFIHVCGEEQWHSLSPYFNQRGIFKKILSST